MFFLAYFSPLLPDLSLTMPGREWRVTPRDLSVHKIEKLACGEGLMEVE